MGYVIFRLDDVQDDWLTKPQAAIIDLFIKHSSGPLSISLGLIGESFKAESDFVRYLKTIFSKYGSFCELVCHGFYHRNFSLMEVSEQRSEIELFLKSMKEFFPAKKISSFIPPFNCYTEATKKILEEYGIEILSGADGKYEKKNLYCLPLLMHANISTNSTDEIKAEFRDPEKVIIDINNNLLADTDWCVVMMHPQEFSIELQDRVDQNAIDNMQKIIDWCILSGHQILNMEQMQAESRTTGYATKFFSF